MADPESLDRPAVDIASNIVQLRRQLRETAAACGRDAEQITLLAVSKTRNSDEIRRAHAAGLVHFGENYLQEALDKIANLTDLPLSWHFIGPLQSNKTAAVAAHFDWVHSVDRAKLLRRLSQQRPDHLPPLNICLQVNTSGEATKSGVSAGQLPELLELADASPRLRLRGLMTIPSPQHAKEEFRALAALQQRHRDRFPQMDTLSMGMSADFEEAIAAGSTVVRIGTGVFGPRPAQQ